MIEVENGLLGAKRDLLMRLIELMTFKNDSLVRNLIGMSGESVYWIYHFHFTVARTFVEKHFERHIIPSKEERGKEITLKFKNIIFKVANRFKKSILINILIKNTILECTFKINKNNQSVFYVNICTSKQINDVKVNWWEKNYSSSFSFDFFGSRIICSGKESHYFKEGGIKKEEEMTAVVNNKNVENKGGKMNIIRNQKRVPHTIVNISKDGVYFGFSCWKGSATLSVISFLHVSVLPPSFNDGMRCIAYDFEGGFESFSYNQKDEEGKKVPNILEYYT